MKLATWNVNSIRARYGRVMDWVKQQQPDVLCMQELKCVDGEFPAEDFRALGYDFAMHGQKTYNGVATCVRAPLALAEVTRGFEDGGDDSQARLIAATVAGIRVVNVYVPNGQAVGTDKYAYKLAWYERLRAYVAAARTRYPNVLVCGDFNVAPAPEDVHDPAAWEGQVLYSIPEREALAAVCAAGVEDVLRRVHPTGQFFTWWDYRMLGFPKNRGLRIDHVLASPELASRARTCVVDREARKGQQPSDHAPLIVELDV